MIRALVRNSDNFVESHIVVAEDSDWPIPDGFRLEDPKGYPVLPIYGPADSVDDKKIGEMTAEEFNAVVAVRTTAETATKI